MWKIFEGFTAQFTNFVKITNTSPTPTFLQGDVGVNLQTEPTKSRATANDTIRFYDTNDPGLLLATPTAIIHEWKQVQTGSATLNLIDWKLLFHKSGSALFNPFSTGSIFTPASGNLNQSVYVPASMSSTTTIMNNIPKVIFWKSSNAYFMVSISKTSGTYAGYAGIMTNSLAAVGYKHNVGAVIHDGEDLQLSILLSGIGIQFIEGVEQAYNTNVTVQSQVTEITPISSIGRPPTSQFSFSSVLNVIGGNLRFGFLNTTVLKVVTDPIEGIFLCSSASVSQSSGTIASYNSKYYLHLETISDGFIAHRKLLQLTT
jgi:hypothetical protein